MFRRSTRVEHITTTRLLDGLPIKAEHEGTDIHFRLHPHSFIPMFLFFPFTSASCYMTCSVWSTLCMWAGCEGPWQNIDLRRAGDETSLVSIRDINPDGWLHFLSLCRHHHHQRQCDETRNHVWDKWMFWVFSLIHDLPDITEGVWLTGHTEASHQGAPAWSRSFDFSFFHPSTQTFLQSCFNKDTPLKFEHFSSNLFSLCQA